MVNALEELSYSLERKPEEQKAARSLLTCDCAQSSIDLDFFLASIVSKLSEPSELSARAHVPLHAQRNGRRQRAEEAASCGQGG